MQSVKKNLDLIAYAHNVLLVLTQKHNLVASKVVTTTTAAYVVECTHNA